MNRFLLLICLIVYCWTPIESNQPSSESMEFNNEVEVEDNVPIVTEPLFNIEAVLKKDNGDEHETIQLSGNEDDQILEFKIQNTSVFVDFKYSFSLLANEGYCLISRISNFQDYKIELENLEKAKSELILDYAFCEYSLMDPDLVSDFGSTAERMCSSEDNIAAVIITECLIISPEEESFTPYPKEVLAKTYQTCLDVSYLCDIMEECSFVCLNGAINSNTIIQAHEFTAGTDESFSSILTAASYKVIENSRIIEGFYAVTHSWGDKLEYIGTMYLDFANEISISINVAEGQCSGIKIPEGIMTYKFLEDIPENTTTVAPVIKCRLEENPDNDRISSNELFNVACKGLKQFEAHECEFVAEEDILEGYPCQFLALMYVEDKSGVYCIQKEASAEEAEEPKETEEQI